MTLIIGYLLAFVVGLSLGVIGGGGSILTVPILVYIFDIQPSLATAYSLVVVGSTALVGALTYAKNKMIDFKTGLVFAVPSFLGVYGARRFVVPAIPDPVISAAHFTLSKNSLIMGVFAAIMVWASLSMIRRKKVNAPAEGHTADANPESAPKNYLLIALEGIVVGAITGFVGAGGGFLVIPALVVLARVPMKIAVGTSLMIIAAKSLIGFVGDIQTTAHIDWGFLGLFAGIAVVGILLGTHFAKFIPGKKLEPAFGWFVLVMGIFIMGKEFL